MATLETPPHDPEIEALLLGAMLLSPEARAAAIPMVSPEHFYVPAHAHIFETIVEQVSRGAEVINAGTTVAAFNGHGDAHKLKVLDLVALTSNVPGSSSVAPQYAATVLKLFFRRRRRFLLAEMRQAELDGNDERFAKFAAQLAALESDAGCIKDDRGTLETDWSELWANQPPAKDFLIEPILAVGRQTAIFSAAKTGKSLLALEMATAAATGRAVLAQSAGEPFDVLYIDLEMTASDLRERLFDLGYGPEDDLSHLHYYQLPSLPPMDTTAGGDAVLAIAQRHGARLVVVDTMARAVNGEENSADTYRDFYTYTGKRLKAAAIALLRLEHQGKDKTKGQRGSSAKDDDVDVVFQLTTTGANTLRLDCTHSRVRWIPSEVNIERVEEPALRHVVSAIGSWPSGTADVAQALDEADVPLDATVRTAHAALKSHFGKGRSTHLVGSALRFRRVTP